MNFKKYILTRNDCYVRGKIHEVKGVMIHSTGADNKKLSRVIAPDDGRIGENRYDNHQNQPGTGIGVHAWIGELEDGTVATYQTLPWNYAGWHAGGKANDNGIVGVEMMEDNLKDPLYFNKVYQEAVELTAELSLEHGFQINKQTVMGHQEGYQMGIASNHSDPEHWMRLHGKSMDTFRGDVKKMIEYNASDFAIPAQKWAMACGITDGLRPSDITTREEVWTMLYRFAIRGIGIGSSVQIMGSKYFGGEVIPEYLLDGVYTIGSVLGERALLNELNSWVLLKDLAIV